MAKAKASIPNVEEMNSVDPSVSKEAAQEPQYKVVALKEFRDKDNWAKVYRVGADISHLSEERIKHLIKIGYAK